MSKNNSSPKNSKIIPLFITFAILFIVVFALGIIVGKGLGGSDTPTIETTYEIGTPDEEPDLEVVEEVLVEDTEKDEVEPPAAKITPEDIGTEKEKTAKEKKDDESLKAEDQVDGTYHIETRSKAPKAVEKTDKPKSGSTQDVIKGIKEDSLKKAPPKEKPPVAKTTMPKTDPGGKYTVQLAAFQNQIQANSLLNSLKSKGYPAFVKQYETPDKKLWYRVRVGTFSTKQQAADYGDKLKKQQPQVKSVFITTNN